MDKWIMGFIILVIIGTIVPDAWYLQVKDIEGRTEWWDVASDTFDLVKIGDYVKKDDGCIIVNPTVQATPKPA